MATNTLFVIVNNTNWRKLPRTT